MDSAMPLITREQQPFMPFAKITAPFHIVDEELPARETLHQRIMLALLMLAKRLAIIHALRLIIPGTDQHPIGITISEPIRGADIQPRHIIILVENARALIPQPLMERGIIHL